MIQSKYNPKIYRLIFSVYSFPAFVILLANVPIIRDIFFALHGGPGWVLAILCTPYVLIRTLVYILKSEGEFRKYYLKIGIISIILYLIVLYPLTSFAENKMTSRGWPIEKGTLYGFMTIPFSLLKPSFWKSDKV